MFCSILRLHVHGVSTPVMFFTLICDAVGFQIHRDRPVFNDAEHPDRWRNQVSLMFDP